jgi:hypothetical protein
VKKISANFRLGGSKAAFLEDPTVKDEDRLISGSRFKAGDGRRKQPL